jgi:hypothetical protein
MSILKPTPGELIDRATILSLKIVFGHVKGMDVSHFKKEEDEVWERLKEEGYAVIEQLDPHTDYAVWEDETKKIIAELQTVNGILWGLEDMVRKTAKHEFMELGKLCVGIAASNDTRSELIQKANKHYFLETKPEKVYDKPKKNFVSDIDLGDAG